MSDDTPDRKVIRITTRMPYEPPAGDAEAVAMDEADPGCQAIMESVQALVANGQIRGLAILGWDAELGRFERFLALPADKDVSNSALHFMSGLDIMKDNLLDIAMVEGGYVEDLERDEDFE